MDRWMGLVSRAGKASDSELYPTNDKRGIMQCSAALVPNLSQTLITVQSLRLQEAEAAIGYSA